MKFCSFASGSTGNCSLVSIGSCNFLIDAGISMRRIVANLKLSGLAPEDIDGLFITHEHSDHISGLAMMLKHYSVPVYAPAAVARALIYRGCCSEHDISLMPVDEPIYFGEAVVSAFHTSHDTAESVGYRFECNGEVFAFATDTGTVTEEVYTGLAGASAVLIESNHDVEMLRSGAYPYPLKRRILSPRGHLSNADCGRLAARLADEGCRCIVLGHLSRENNRPELAFAEVRRALGEREIQLHVAPEAERLNIELGGVKLW